MTLSTVVQGDPAACRATGRWMTSTYADAVQRCGDGVHRARTGSQDCWTGGAADAFRTRMHDAGIQSDDLAQGAQRVVRALQTYADSLDAARARMAQAREIASAGGLPVSGTTIGDPGPAPVHPGPQEGPVSPAAADAHASQTDAWTAHQAKTRAYQQAGEQTSDAGEIVSDAATALVAVLTDQLSKAPLTAFDGLAGLVAGYGAWAAKQGTFARTAGIAGRLAANSNLSYRGAVRALLIQRENLDKAAAAAARANTPLARAISRLPQGSRDLLAMHGDELVPDGTGALARGSRAVLGKIPVAGAAVTAFGIGSDIAGGKDPGKAIFSGVAGMGAGMAAGALLASNPVGWAVAGSVVAGIGVGYAADWAWDNGVGEAVGDAGDAIGDAAGDAADFVGDLV
ncbi:MAG: WXG100 family type VII secretion target [Actinomycetes bacterium]